MENELKNLDHMAIIETEQAIEVMQKAGPEALAVYFILQAKCPSTESLNLEAIAKLSGMSIADVERACYQLGIVMLGIEK